MTTPKQDEPVQVIALVRITEPNGDGTDKTYHNGTIFTTTPEKAAYYMENCYARTPTDDELNALGRMPKPKAPLNRQQQPVPVGETKKVGRGHQRRDVSSRD